MNPLLKDKKTRRSAGRTRKYLYLLGFMVILKPPGGNAHELEVQVLSEEGPPVSGVAVYMESVNTGGTSAAAAPITVIEQKNKKFSPYLRVSKTGKPVLFTNEDDITHHIYSVTGDTRFSFKLRAGEQKRLDIFDSAGPVPMGCNIHDWMSGFLLVVDTPYYGRTNERGLVNFSNLPEGSYRAVAWHPQMQEPESPVSSVEIPENQEIVFHLKRPMQTMPDQKPTHDFEFLEDY